MRKRIKPVVEWSALLGLCDGSVEQFLGDQFRKLMVGGVATSKELDKLALLGSSIRHVEAMLRKSLHAAQDGKDIKAGDEFREISLDDLLEMIREVADTQR